MFSPITQRSFKIRLLQTSFYALLFLGGLTMVLPFMIMITGSVESRPETRNALLPGFLFSQEEMWQRYLDAKYQGNSDYLRTAWNQRAISFQERIALPAAAGEHIPLWEKFLRENTLPPQLFLPAFLRLNSRMPSFTARQFRIWLLQQYDGDLLQLNADLGTQFPSITLIFPPNPGLVGATQPQTKLLARMNEFLALEPASRMIAWNVGGYFRTIYLPYVHGNDVAAYNAKYGTSYSQYAEVPFPSLAPVTGVDDWLNFVSRVLRPNFVDLTEEGKSAMTAAGITKEEFIRTTARPVHVRVESADTLFSEWAARQGMRDARIPQQQLDREAFLAEQGFWKWQFLIMNYQRVVDEILLHGRAIGNTVILVVLSISGALIVNPLAAYALSRYKLRKTYHILLFCLATIAFPGEVTMIPVFLQMKEFHLLNTFGALILPSLANGFSIFLLKGFFDSLPKELFEAAELDGASEWTMFWQITMNLSRPILAVIALGAFATAYGTFFYALILAPDPKMWTIMVYIYQLRMGVDSPVVYASLIITAIPTLLMFIFCQNIILRGIVVPSEK